MPRLTLKSLDGTLLYAGSFSSVRRCVESAVGAGQPLDRADLHLAALSHANLDDLRLCGGSLRGANLSGTNLSDSDLDGTDLREASLQNTCLAYASLRGCWFEGASFGATDLTGADISHARFSGLSTFSLDFTHCRSMDKTCFVSPDGELCPMTRPPLVLRGLTFTPLALLDRHVWVNHRVIGRGMWTAAPRRQRMTRVIPDHDPCRDPTPDEAHRPLDRLDSLIYFLETLEATPGKIQLRPRNPLRR